MKCLVCKKEFTGNACPRCGFPVVESTDVDALLESMRSQIENYRNDFFAGVRLELVICNWEAMDGKIVQKNRQRIGFGNCKDLCAKETLLPQKFARIPDAPSIQPEIRIAYGKETKSVRVPLPNLNEPSLQSIGVEVNDEMQFRLLLVNEKGSRTHSPWVSVM